MRMGCLKCLKVSTIPLALIVFIFYIIALCSHYWTTCDTWNYNNGLWEKCVNDDCTRLYEASATYRYRDPRCNGKANAYYVIDNTCKNYYRCMDGAYDLYNCTSGQFNINSGRCESTSPTGCIDIRCSNAVNNQYYRTDGTVCKSYYRCVNNVYSAGTCGANEYFSLSSNTCTGTRPSGCQDPKCAGVQDGWYIKDSPTCKQYYVCSGGLLTDNQQCLNSGQVANPTTRTCSSVAISTCKDPRCYNKADAYYVTSNACRSWYRCNQGYYTSGSCNSNEYYDVSNNQCTTTRPSSCVDYRCSAYGMTNTYMVTDTSCTSYYTCIGGVYTTAACPISPNQQYYDIASRQCINSVPSSCRNPKCNNKAEGWYITDSPTCRQYYICHTGGVITDNQNCGNTQVANPTTRSCSGVAISTCKDPRCYSVNDGYYRSDLWCKSYYRCNGGYYTSGICGSGTYFDTSTNQCSSTKPTACYDERCSTLGVNSGWRVTDTTCTSYYRCNSGVYTSNSCNNNQQFNTGLGVCQSTTPTNCRDSRCDGKSDGYHVVDNTCRSYYRCQSGVYSAWSCSVGQVFVISSDRQTGSCRTYTDSGSTTCKDPRCISNPNSNGWRDKISSYCRSYYVCSNGFYTNQECPAYQYWDDINDVCTTTTPTGCRDHRCYGVANGKYRVDRDCINYYQCTNGVTATTGSCGGGTKFQQTTGTCVSIANPVGCKINGAYGHWTLWGACTAASGFGVKTRSRGCNNPAPSWGGNNCDGLGPAIETTMCWACPAADWVNGARACMCMATLGSFLALVYAIVLNCSTSRHPICTTGALFFLALTTGMAALIVYHSNIDDVPGCELETGWSMVLGWLGVILAAIGYIVAMIAMCQAGETRVSSSDGMQMRTKMT